MVIEPSLCGRTLTSTDAFWPFVIVPSGHVTVPLDCEQAPCEGVAETKVTPAGRVSVTWTPVAVDGPPLAAVSVYVRSWPATTGSGESDLVSDRSTAESTAVKTLAVLFPESGSSTLEVTLAWLPTEPGDCGLTLISTVTSWPFTSVPSEQLTVPLDCEHDPWEGVAESNVTPAEGCR